MGSDCNTSQSPYEQGELTKTETLKLSYLGSNIELKIKDTFKENN